MSRAIVLRAPKDAEPACQVWLVYVRDQQDTEIMIDVCRSRDLMTRDLILKRFTHVPGAYAVPGGE